MAARNNPDMETADARARLLKEAADKYDGTQLARLARGIDQVLTLWRPEDGGLDTLGDFVAENFMVEGEELDALFARMEFVLESLEGHLVDVSRDLRMHADVEGGPVRAYDEVLAGYDPAAHVVDDFFDNKLAFTVLLNFPLTTLAGRLEAGETWSRRQWAEARLAQRFSKRMPAHVNLAVARAQSDAEQYIGGYNIWMHHLLDQSGRRLFPEGMRLISHWGLREEVKAAYADPANGLAKQRVIQQVMERIVEQSIPAVVIDNPRVDWDPNTNEVTQTSAIDFDESQFPPLDGVDNVAEPDTRYERLLEVFHAASLGDPYCPGSPTAIDRCFDEDRELPEARTTRMFTDVLQSPLVARTADLIARRLGRPLEPFDLWYTGFGQEPTATSELDEATRTRYPTAAAFEADIPRILAALGFADEQAAYVAGNIEVHSSRGAGHAFGAGRKGARSFLRTRVEAGGMDYKGYNIAVHELGHNVEQTYSLNDVDHYLLSGVPNNACTEALAFVFQKRDLELLGMAESQPSSANDVLAHLWTTYEIAGVALVEVAAWHWMYEHPEASPSDFREAVLAIARDVWNKHYADVLGAADSVLLGIYSHMIGVALYLAEYPIGHMIEFQIGQHLQGVGAVGPEFARISKIGRVSPDLWMKHAVGSPIGPEALLDASEHALEELAVRD